MTIEFRCDQCGELLRTSDEKAGWQAKCPGCGTPVTVPHSESDANDALDLDDEFYDDFDDKFGEGSSAPRAGRTKTCPMCGEQIHAASLKCRYCGEEFDEPGRRVRPICPSTQRMGAT